MCARAADVLDVKIYGGDVIVGDDGSMNIIDFNDWPSFAPAAATSQIHPLCDKRHQRNTQHNR